MPTLTSCSTRLGAPDTRWDRPVPINAWWGAWLAYGMLSRATPSHSAVGWIDWLAVMLCVLSGVLCVMVVRGIDARRQERMRRLLAQRIAAERPRWPSPGTDAAPASLDGSDGPGGDAAPGTEHGP